MDSPVHRVLDKGEGLPPHDHGTGLAPPSWAPSKPASLQLTRTEQVVASSPSMYFGTMGLTCSVPTTVQLKFCAQHLATPTKLYPTVLRRVDMLRVLIPEPA